MSEAILEVCGLTCERGERTLFRNLSFAVKPGTLVRIAGSNGAGKTTLLRLMTGLMEVVGEAVALDVSGPDGLDAPDVADHVRDLLLAVEEVLAFLLKGFATGEKKGGEGGADDQSALHMHG